MSSHSIFTIGFKLLGIGGLVFANAFFVAAEFSLVAVRRSRISTLAANGNRLAPVTLELLDNLDAVISSTQLGITISSLGLGWIGETTLSSLLEPLLAIVIPSSLVVTISTHAIAAAISFAIITFLHIVLGELAPKSIALERAEMVSLYVATPLKLFYNIFKPFIWALNACGNLTVRLLGLHHTAEHQQAYTEEEIHQLVSISHQSGHLNADERELIHNVLHFTSSVVREVMVPRQSIACTKLNANFQEVLKAFQESGYSRLPIYEEQQDNIVGVIHSKDILPYFSNKTFFSLKALLRKPVFIPDTAHLEEALRQLRSAKTELALVVDEHGNVEGMVTMEDLLEEIVGEIHDEHDVEAEETLFWKLPDDTILIDGRISIREANRKLDLHLPESDDYTTLAGFLITEAGKLLLPGDVITHQETKFTVENVEGRRITRVKVVSR